MKKCGKCGKVKPLDDFTRSKNRSDGRHGLCKVCRAEYVRKNRDLVNKTRNEWRYKTGRAMPMGENRECAAFLGIHVAEKALAATFENVTRMPTGNTGYDFICGKGFKIDVKSSCRNVQEGVADSWKFHIHYNEIPDYFLCIAFDNRDSLNPEHLWLIPGDVVNKKASARVSVSTLSRWAKYEKPVDEVISCCNALKDGKDTTGDKQ